MPSGLCSLRGTPCHACCPARRAVLVQLGFFFHMQLALGSAAPAITRPIAFATAFMLLFRCGCAALAELPACLLPCSLPVCVLFRVPVACMFPACGECQGCGQHANPLPAACGSGLPLISEQQDNAMAVRWPLLAAW